MITVGLSILAFIATLAALSMRDEDFLRELWLQILLKPGNRQQCKLVARHGAASERYIAVTRAQAVDAQRRGDVAEAERLTRAAAVHEEETREERQRSSFLRRMLSAIE